MKNLTVEQKAKKAAYNKAYAAKKKAQTIENAMVFNEDKFEKTFEHKVRLYKNLKIRRWFRK